VLAAGAQQADLAATAKTKYGETLAALSRAQGYNQEGCVAIIAR